MPRSATKPLSKGKPTPRPDPAIANLEPVADATQIYSLQQLLTNKANPRTRDAARLGEVLLPWYEKAVAKPAAKLDGITELWLALLPANMLDRTRLVSFVRGTLTVAVDSAPLRAMLDTQLRASLLQQLQTASRGTIYRVKTSVDATFSSASRVHR